MTKINTAFTRSIKNTYLTAKGLVDAKAELAFLKKNKRLEIAEKIHQARQYGDLTENSEYDSAIEDQALTENRISELENILKNFKVIAEADPSKKRISNESPLGIALLGAKKGEAVEVATPIVKYKCKVLEIK